MDPATLNVLAGILQHGGSAALFVALWVAYQAAKKAQAAVDALLRIDATLADIDKRLQAQNPKPQ